MIRRSVAAVLVVVLALALAGCGGGGSAEAPAPTPTAPAQPAPVAQAEEEDPDRSNVEPEVFEPFPEGTFIPEEVTKRLEMKPIQPMLLFFHSEASRETTNVRGVVKSVVEDNKGAIDLISFDMGRYTTVDDKGNVVVNESKFVADEQAKKAATLARELGIRNTPAVVLVDDQGYVIFRWRGYIDEQALSRQVARTKK